MYGCIVGTSQANNRFRTISFLCFPWFCRKGVLSAERKNVYELFWDNA